MSGPIVHRVGGEGVPAGEDEGLARDTLGRLSALQGFVAMRKAKHEALDNFRANVLDTRDLIITATDAHNVLHLPHDRFLSFDRCVLNGKSVSVRQMTMRCGNYETAEAAEKFFRDQASVSEVTIVSDQGWCLYWKWNQERSRIRFRLFQFRVNGQPFTLPGEARDAIVFSWKAEEKESPRNV